MWQNRQLIGRLQRGRVDALRLIYDKYKLDLLKLAIVLTGDIGQSEDVVQDVFLKLAESYDRLGAHSNLRNFLITCLVNRSAIERGQVGRPDRWAVVNEQMQRISEAMAELPLEQREVITLRFEGGMGFRQIARFQNASINTVQGRYRYGMEKLRSLLNSEAET